MQLIGVRLLEGIYVYRVWFKYVVQWWQVLDSSRRNEIVGVVLRYFSFDEQEEFRVIIFEVFDYCDLFFLLDFGEGVLSFQGKGNFYQVVVGYRKYRDFRFF